MDKKKGLLNITSSILSRVVLLIAALYVRRLLIVYVGNEVNGLNSLYASIIGLLSVAELGVGSAIVFSMYKPIVEEDTQKISALYCLYRKLYRIIGVVILVAGIVVMPFLPRLISDYDSLDVNVYLTFFLTLISVVISYLYSAKISLIEAYKDNYITISIATISRMLRYAMQIAALMIWKSFVVFLICQIIETVIVWIMTEYAVRKLHPDIIRMYEKMDEEATREVSRNIKAMFMHKIGAILVGAVDSMVISAFIGVVMLGRYSNYVAIATAMTGIISLLFTPLTSVIGHLCALSKPQDIKNYFNHFYSINYIVGVIFYLGYFAVTGNVVAILFGNDLEVSRIIVFVITLNQFTIYMRYSPLLFRDASGTFYYDRWKPLAEGVTNLILSIILVKLLPGEYAVAGVIMATIVTTLLICDVVEPHILYKYVFKEPAARFYIRNYGGIAVFVICLIVLEHLRVSLDSNIAEFFINGIISIGVSTAVLVLLSLLDSSFGRECRIIMTQTTEWVRKGMQLSNEGK